METSLFDYALPEELIAQEPVEPRDASRLLIVHRATGQLEHRHFYDLPDYLQAGDTLVLNDTRVSARRLFGRKPTGGRVELLLLRPLGDGRWHALVRPGRRLPEGSLILLDEGHTAQIEARLEEGIRLVRFIPPDDAWLQQVGQIPLHRQLTDPERYQTVFARAWIPSAPCSLDSEHVEAHKMHGEWFTLSPEAAAVINQTRGRIVAVGTTSVRVLESAAVGRRQVQPLTGETRLYITPGYAFKVVDALITNFHAPRTTVLVLVCAFAGRELILHAYQEAIRLRYRFLSFGDAMLIL
jgi:S-adenosylmethionine:tRNA ribosyltransferase-isomerase